MGLFDYLDDPERLGAHMSQSSWMMLGGALTYQLDAARGKTIGAHIAMSGRLLGLRLSLDEVVTRREIPTQKTWKTVGTPRLLVIGNYEMGFEITPHEERSGLRIFITYFLPRGPS